MIGSKEFMYEWRDISHAYIFTGYNIPVIAEHKAPQHSPDPCRALLLANAILVFMVAM